MAQLLKEHYENHPAMEPRDAIKFLYHSRMGPGHLISDPAAAQARLDQEWDQVEGARGVPLGESLGNGMFRLDIKACKGLGLSSTTLGRLFELTARETAGDLAALDKDLELVYTLPFPREMIRQELERYRAQGCPPISHSPAYRLAYAPAYRVVSQYYVNILPVLTALDALLARGEPVRAAIDGPCASGKSTLGEALGRIYRCPVVHMDDFYLLPHQRTPARLEEPGGNVDYERFQREVLSPLVRGEQARYRPWRCREGQFGEELSIKGDPLTVIEGSYSLRPDFRESYHLRVWVEAPWAVRLERLEQRGGPGCVRRFLEQWIPLEDRYFSACQVKDCCQVVLGADDR